VIKDINEYDPQILIDTLKNESKNFPKLSQEEKDRVNEEFRYFKKRSSLIKDALVFFKIRDKIGRGKLNKPNSIIFYLLGITEKKPDLNHWIQFDYELDKESSRQSPPDIDVDFEHRDSILNYLCDKYGKEHVSLIGTSIGYKPKAAIQMAAKALDVTRTQREGERRFSQENDKEAKRISKLIPNTAVNISIAQWMGEDENFEPANSNMADVMKLLKPEIAKYPEVFRHAKKLEGKIKSYGTHAAGVVISRDPLIQDVPLHYTKMIKDFDVDSLESLAGEEHISLVRLPSTQYDMEEVEELGLLKFDFLQLENLRQMSLIKKMSRKSNYKGKTDLTLVDDNHYSTFPYEDKKVCIDNLETNDPNVFKTIKDLKLEGIFQLSGPVFRSGYLREKNWDTGEFLFNPDGTPRMKYRKGLMEIIGCDNFEDIVVANAIGRPGPLKSRVHYEYVNKKKHPDSIEYLHPKLKNILGVTYSLLIYQEQLIKMSMILAGFTFAQADKLRKACAKKKKELLDEIEPKYREGCKKNNIQQNIIDASWGIAVNFGSYSFNRSHSAAYALISYQTSFLKTYFINEFISAVLSSSVSNDVKLNYLIKSFKEEYKDLKILSPEINLSKDTYFPSGNLSIVAPFSSIKGLGDKVSVALVEKQPYASVYDFAMKHASMGESTINMLIELDVFRNFGSKEEVSKEFRNVQIIKKRVLKNVSITTKTPKAIDLF